MTNKPVFFKNLFHLLDIKSHKRPVSDLQFFHNVLYKCYDIYLRRWTPLLLFTYHIVVCDVITDGTLFRFGAFDKPEKGLSFPRAEF